MARAANEPPLPIIETPGQADVSAYIPHQRDLNHRGPDLPSSDLFTQALRPAINVGISGSRVGGAAPNQAIKKEKIAGTLKLELASVLDELRPSPSFASDPSDAQPRRSNWAVASACANCSTSRNSDPLILAEQSGWWSYMRVQGP